MGKILTQLLYRLRTNKFYLLGLKFFLFFLLVFILDYAIGNLLKYFYFKQESGLQYRATYVIEKTKADILIFGSSRASYHYISTVFEDKMRLSCFNAGRYGSPILYHLAILKSVLKRHHPKTIILDLNLQDFEKREGSYDILSCLLPYYDSHPEMRSIILKRGKYEQLKLISNIYPYNSEMLTIAIGNTEINKKRKEDIKGFTPIRANWNDKIENYRFPQIYELDSTKVKAFTTFINDCKKAKIKLFIVCSPYLSKNKIKESTIEKGKEIARNYHIPFFDYSNYKPLLKTVLFYDAPHMNSEGAKVFSNLVVNDILRSNKK
ncbi:hypothetical protein [Pedobacter alpinus]|uniref:SGNH hydrolase-type esterase domain-containing protein n=1 Tax=Pedobacter alpinus TaxID=1590643 RepID=A0ABW5TS05_9SPHI